MRILVVAATEAEVAPVLSTIGAPESGRLRSGRHAGHQVDVLMTGVGMVATAAWCAHTLARSRYELALNLGVCGSFDPALGPATVVHVVSDRIADLGVEDGEQFLTIQELNLIGDNDFPFQDGRLVNRNPPANAALGVLPGVDGITVNTAHGHAESIAAVVRRFNPRIESMEGAGFMYTCLIHQLAFAQVRAVSNFVERRNRGAWKLAEAIHALNEAALRIVSGDQA